ncbi:hypothetical protein JDV02_008865 [Purpureocillium takamizusanense]|uniref:Uncharacterized protein n=1 Tax=Purpureocillium takamizusanense TaxID=2060973 RepID=A0A9Q8QPK0_9HYPO|nr:uncharacterized protein JDV02_008865 [Purpureocillium takamizusanense]UNI23022.1 hypothetical protein JDV02_008865 [Purpureocillium takamizusanense]
MNVARPSPNGHGGAKQVMMSLLHFALGILSLHVLGLAVVASPTKPQQAEHDHALEARRVEPSPAYVDREREIHTIVEYEVGCPKNVTEHPAYGTICEQQSTCCDNGVFTPPAMLAHDCGGCRCTANYRHFELCPEVEL